MVAPSMWFVSAVSSTVSLGAEYTEISLIAHVDPVHGAAVGGQYGHLHGGRLLCLVKQDDLLLLGAGVLLIHLGIGVALLQLDFKTGDVLIGIFALEIDVDLLDGLGAAKPTSIHSFAALFCACPAVCRDTAVRRPSSGAVVADFIMNWP